MWWWIRASFIMAADLLRHPNLGDYTLSPLFLFWGEDDWGDFLSHFKLGQNNYWAN
jgi:hypothetical protein